MNRAFAAVGAHRPPLAVPETADACSRSRRFDRCANACSLYPPQAVLAGPPLAVPETADARFHSRRFDRCADPCSLYPPPAALAGVAVLFPGSNPRARRTSRGKERVQPEGIHRREDAVNIRRPFHGQRIFGAPRLPDRSARTKKIPIHPKGVSVFLWEDYKIDFFAFFVGVFVPLRKILNFQG